MRPLPSRFRSAALAAAAVLALCGEDAAAQPCCAGNNLLTPARLANHEDELVALQWRAGDVVGSYDAARNLLGTGGASEVDLEQDLLGTVRFLARGQVSLVVPLVETGRGASGSSEFGGGLGDLSLSGRWDFLNAGEKRGAPGIAVLAGVTAPTGRAPESATRPLGTDATGAGAWQAAVGFAIEQQWRHLFVTGTALVTQSAPRHFQGISETLGLQVSAGAALGWAFDDGLAAGLTATYVGSRDAVLNGALVPRSGRARTLLGIALSKPIGEDWRIQGALSGQVPLPGLGQNETALIGASLLVIRGWM